MRERINSFARRLLTWARQGGSPVVLTHDFMGWGNHLGLLLWAYQERNQGRKSTIVVTEKMRPWLKQFPSLVHLTQERDAVRIWQPRAQPWRIDPYGIHPAEDTESFVRTYLLTSPLLQGPSRIGPDVVVVNVRRGDYYSNPSVNREFGINITGYLHTAITRSAEIAPISKVHIISDDIAWCRENLQGLVETATITFADSTDTPEQNFADLSHARRLIISNSTFSYWAAYVSTVRFGDNHANIVAPAFFSRNLESLRGKDLDPRWSIIEEIPGGWDGTS
jgi:hypothetical protein